MPLKLVMKKDMEKRKEIEASKENQKAEETKTKKEKQEKSDAPVKETKPRTNSATKENPVKNDNDGPKRKHVSPRDDRPKKRVIRNKRESPRGNGGKQNATPKGRAGGNMQRGDYKRPNNVRQRSPGRRSRSKSPPRRGRNFGKPQRSDPRTRRPPPRRGSIGNWICGGCKARNSKDSSVCYACNKRRDLPRGTGRNRNPPPRNSRPLPPRNRNVGKRPPMRRSPVRRNSSPNDFRNSYRRASGQDFAPPQGPGHAQQIGEWNSGMPIPQQQIHQPFPAPQGMHQPPVQMQTLPMPSVAALPPPDPFAPMRVKNKFLPEQIPANAQFTSQGTLIVPF